jgi:hypothetical protein
LGALRWLVARHAELRVVRDVCGSKNCVGKDPEGADDNPRVLEEGHKTRIAGSALVRPSGHSTLPRASLRGNDTRFGRPCLDEKTEELGTRYDDYPSEHHSTFIVPGTP